VSGVPSAQGGQALIGRPFAGGRAVGRLLFGSLMNVITAIADA
jgi:hypothetical protein